MNILQIYFKLNCWCLSANAPRHSENTTNNLPFSAVPWNVDWFLNQKIFKIFTLLLNQMSHKISCSRGLKDKQIFLNCSALVWKNVKQSLYFPKDFNFLSGWSKTTDCWEQTAVLAGSWPAILYRKCCCSTRAGSWLQLIIRAGGWANSTHAHDTQWRMPPWKRTEGV